MRQRHAETGETEPRSCCNGRQAKWLSYADRLQQLVQERPDATLAELAAALEHELSPQSIWRALRALKLSFKKSRSRGRARSA